MQKHGTLVRPLICYKIHNLFRLFDTFLLKYISCIFVKIYIKPNSQLI